MIPSNYNEQNWSRCATEQRGVDCRFVVTKTSVYVASGVKILKSYRPWTPTIEIESELDEVISNFIETAIDFERSAPQSRDSSVVQLVGDDCRSDVLVRSDCDQLSPRSSTFTLSPSHSVANSVDFTAGLDSRPSVLQSWLQQQRHQEDWNIIVPQAVSSLPPQQHSPVSEGKHVDWKRNGFLDLKEFLPANSHFVADKKPLSSATHSSFEQNWSDRTYSKHSRNLTEDLCNGQNTSHSGGYKVDLSGLDDFLLDPSQEMDSSRTAAEWRSSFMSVREKFSSGGAPNRAGYDRSLSVTPNFSCNQKGKLSGRLSGQNSPFGRSPSPFESENDYDIGPPTFRSSPMLTKSRSAHDVSLLVRKIQSLAESAKSFAPDYEENSQFLRRTIGDHTRSRPSKSKVSEFWFKSVEKSSKPISAFSHDPNFEEPTTTGGCSTPKSVLPFFRRGSVPDATGKLPNGQDKSSEEARPMRISEDQLNFSALNAVVEESGSIKSSRRVNDSGPIGNFIPASAGSLERPMASYRIPNGSSWASAAHTGYSEELAGMASSTASPTNGDISAALELTSNQKSTDANKSSYLQTTKDKKISDSTATQHLRGSKWIMNNTNKFPTDAISTENTFEGSVNFETLDELLTSDGKKNVRSEKESAQTWLKSSVSSSVSNGNENFMGCADTNTLVHAEPALKIISEVESFLESNRHLLAKKNARPDSFLSMEANLRKLPATDTVLGAASRDSVSPALSIYSSKSETSPSPLEESDSTGLSLLPHPKPKHNYSEGREIGGKMSPGVRVGTTFSFATGSVAERVMQFENCPTLGSDNNSKSPLKAKGQLYAQAGRKFVQSTMAVFDSTYPTAAALRLQVGTDCSG